MYKMPAPAFVPNSPDSVQFRTKIQPFAAQIDRLDTSSVLDVFIFNRRLLQI
jgi:hypothetical protein